ncbi:unnamed protein product [Gulo gulo]|uniref:Uncharacterized protein n=1 Tax=Gulo gulo TaxID=48420 RepID=A0A9X9LVV7_GULGU|nr:unnamed protein product [Gulo gulo]
MGSWPTGRVRTEACVCSDKVLITVFLRVT